MVNKNAHDIVTGSIVRRGMYVVLTRRVIVGAAVVVVALSSGIGFAVWRHATNAPAFAETARIQAANKAEIASMFPQSASARDAQDEASAQWETGREAAAQAILDAAIAKTTGSVDLTSLYLTKSQCTADIAKALQFARKAESLGPSAATAGAVGDAAVAAGDRQLAITSFQAQIIRLDPSIRDSVESAIEQKITELGG